MIERKTLSQLYKKYRQDCIDRLFGNEWTPKKEETFNRLEDRVTRAFKKAVREDNKEELNAFVKWYLYCTGEIKKIYLDSLCTVSNVEKYKELPKEEREEALNKINNCTYEELEKEIIKLIGVDFYKEILNKYIEAQKKIIKTKDKQLIRNSYTNDILNTYASLNAPLESNKKAKSNHKPKEEKTKEKKRTVTLSKYTVISNELAKSIDNKEEFIKVQPIYDNPKIHAKTRTELNRVRNSIEAYLTTRKEEILFKRVKDKQKIIGYEIEYTNKK